MWANQVPILTTFYELTFFWYFGAKNYKAVFWVWNFFRQNIGKKSLRKILMKLTPGAILPTFYEQIFWTKVLFETIMCLQIGCLTFLGKDINAKATCKMLVKLSASVYFSNILRVPFLFYTAQLSLT